MKVVYRIGGTEDVPGRVITLFNADPPKEGARVQLSVNGSPLGPMYYADTVTHFVDTRDHSRSYVDVTLREDES